MPSVPKQKRPVTGPPAMLVERIEHLATLLVHLPKSLPEASDDSTYQFYLDDEKIEDIGIYPELNHHLEICFGTWKAPDTVVRFTERGPHLKGLIAILKRTIREDPGCREFVRTHWLERLIVAAKESGAKIPDKR